ncbi:type IV pilin protein [Marinobacter salicampi]|uniref:type IV pilin protein n=1 Tax=Marinobacter salicampi TaxID=435907 RepID=UPI001407DD6C|nr:type II secretion system protein [Marinobacter salicampi]
MRTEIAPRSSGFTLVELVMVIILIGVLSVLGIGLFAGRSAFSPLLATQQLASSVLLAQQAGLAGNGASQLDVVQGAEDFMFRIQNGGTTVQEFSIPRAGTSFSVAGASFPIVFGADGAPNIGGNAQLTFSGDSTFTLCLSSLGSVYAGSCQP